MKYLSVWILCLGVAGDDAAEPAAGRRPLIVAATGVPPHVQRQLSSSSPCCHRPHNQVFSLRMAKKKVVKKYSVVESEPEP
jgi:hypothetical protein